MAIAINISYPTSVITIIVSLKTPLKYRKLKLQKKIKRFQTFRVRLPYILSNDAGFNIVVCYSSI